MKQEIVSFIKGKTDRWGIWVSLTCLLHCMAIPVLLFLSPTLAIIFEHEIIHAALLILVIPLVLSSFSSFNAIKKDQRFYSYFGPIGIILLLISLGLELIYGHHPTLKGEAISLLGSMFLIVFHWKNILYKRELKKSNK